MSYVSYMSYVELYELRYELCKLYEYFYENDITFFIIYKDEFKTSKI